MSRILTKTECLELDIELFNKAMELQYDQHKVEKNLSGDLSICAHCSRKYVICCICDKAEKRWDQSIAEIRSLREKNRSMGTTKKAVVLRNGRYRIEVTKKELDIIKECADTFSAMCGNGEDEADAQCERIVKHIDKMLNRNKLPVRDYK